jgi:hypothetical protein
MNARRASIATVGILVTTLALAGCGSANVQIGSSQGIGECDSVPINLSVTQNAAGDTVNIDYIGPSDVSIIAYQGIYSDSRFWGLNPTESLIFNYPIEETTSPFDYAVNAIDFQSAPWTVTTPGGPNIMAEFDGSIDEFVADLDYNTENSAPEFQLYDKLLPVTVGVVCQDGLTSDLIESPSLDSDNVIEGFEVEVAQPFYPNFMYVDAPTVTQQRKIDNGVRGRMVLPDELVNALPDDLPEVAVNASIAYIGDDDPYAPVTDDRPYTLTNASIGEVWLLTLEGLSTSGAEAPVMEIGRIDSLSEPMTFWFTGAEEPEDGYYLVTLTAGNAADGPVEFKVATAVLYYSAERGLTLSGLDEPIVLDKLADTGGDPNVIIWAVLGGLVVLAAVALRPKRRKAQAESTIDPSARNE